MLRVKKLESHVIESFKGTRIVIFKCSDNLDFVCVELGDLFILLSTIQCIKQLHTIPVYGCTTLGHILLPKNAMSLIGYNPGFCQVLN